MMKMTKIEAMAQQKANNDDYADNETSYYQGKVLMVKYWKWRGHRAKIKMELFFFTWEHKVLIARKIPYEFIHLSIIVVSCHTIYFSFTTFPPIMCTCHQSNI